MENPVSSMNITLYQAKMKESRRKSPSTGQTFPAMQGFLPNQWDPLLVYSISMVEVPLYLNYQVDLPISSDVSIPLENSSSIMQEVGTLSQATVRKRSMWTEEEHRNFLRGIKIYGKGRWNLISKKVVRTKTSSEVASHAQKYFLRQNVSPDKRKRRSIHDITDADLRAHTIASTPACRISGGVSSSLFTAAAAPSYGTDRSSGVSSFSRNSSPPVPNPIGG